MRLLSVEIEGFRCITEKIRLDLRASDGKSPLSFAAIVGPNGSGKTTILEAIAGLISRVMAGAFSGGVEKAQHIDLELSSGPRLRLHRGRLRCGDRSQLIAPDAEALDRTLYFPSGHDPYLVENLALEAESRADPQPLRSLLFRASPTRIHLVHQWLLRQELLGQTATDLWAILNEFMGGLEYLGVNSDDHVLSFRSHGEVVGFNQLSSGQRRAIILFAEAFMHCAPDGILLFDEPEAHFHPSWQRRLRGALTQLLPEGQIILATHSPFIVDGLDAAELHILGPVDDEVPTT